MLHKSWLTETDWFNGWVTETYDRIFSSLLCAHIPWTDSVSAVSSSLWHSKMPASIASPRGEISTTRQQNLQRTQLWEAALKYKPERTEGTLCQRLWQKVALSGGSLIILLKCQLLQGSYWPAVDDADCTGRQLLLCETLQLQTSAFQLQRKTAQPQMHL